MHSYVSIHRSYFLIFKSYQKSTEVCMGKIVILGEILQYF